MKTNYKQGFMILSILILISAFLSIYALYQSQDSILLQYAIARTRDKKQSYYVARSCAEIALLKLAVNKNYSGNEEFKIENDECRVEQIADRKIITSAYVGAIKTRLETTISQDLEIIKIIEI
jgi:hypothetical protein